MNKRQLIQLAIIFDSLPDDSFIASIKNNIEELMIMVYDSTKYYVFLWEGSNWRLVGHGPIKTPIN
jgi:hypothetical protein